MRLSVAIEKYDNTQLLHFLQEEIESNGNQQELMQMMKWNNPDNNEEIQCTSLQLEIF